MDQMRRFYQSKGKKIKLTLGILPQNMHLRSHSVFQVRFSTSNNSRHITTASALFLYVQYVWNHYNETIQEHRHHMITCFAYRCLPLRPLIEELVIDYDGASEIIDVILSCQIELNAYIFELYQLLVWIIC